MQSLDAKQERELERLTALGATIRQLRRGKNFTQEELASLVGVHESYISLVERGKRNPTWGVILRISFALGIDLADLARAQTPMPQLRTRNPKSEGC